MAPTTVNPNPTSRSRLLELTSRLGPWCKELAELHDLVEQLQAECDQMRQQIEQLQAERDQLRVERSMLLHAWADEVFPEEELERSSAEPGGGPLADLWKRLGNV